MSQEFLWIIVGAYVAGSIIPVQCVAAWVGSFFSRSD